MRFPTCLVELKILRIPFEVFFLNYQDGVDYSVFCLLLDVCNKSGVLHSPMCLIVSCPNTNPLKSLVLNLKPY